MSSDFEPIAQSICVGCGRGSDQVALKRINTYSRAFSCVTCYVKYSNCENCGHEKHGAMHMVIAVGAPRPPQGSCHCGCRDYRHGLEREFDSQFAAATGRKPAQARCRHCGNWFKPNPESGALICEQCERDRRAING